MAKEKGKWKEKLKNDLDKEKRLAYSIHRAEAKQQKNKLSAANAQNLCSDTETIIL